MATIRTGNGEYDYDEYQKQLISGKAGEGRGTKGSEFTFHFADGRDVTGGWDPELGAGTRVGDSQLVARPQGSSSGAVSGSGLTSGGMAKYTADNGMTYTSANPLGPEEIVNRYVGTINSEPTKQESERTKTAYERLRGYDDNRPQYTQSDTVTAALDRLRAAEEARPGAYDNRYQADIDAILDSLKNREGFSYNPEEDQLYKSYRDQYLRLGQRAMQDSIGTAAAMSGGYGSSYAQRAGQQAYQDYLSGMNDALSAMYGQAYQEYRDQGNDLYSRLDALRALENEDYARYRDALNDYLTERNYANTRYADERDQDYGRYRDTVGDWEADRNYWNTLYGNERNWDLTEYANQLAQWQADREYWDSLLQNLIAYNGIGGGMADQAALQPINVTVNPQDSWAQIYAMQKAATPVSGGTGKTGGVSDAVRAAAMAGGNKKTGKTSEPTMVGTGWSEDQLKAYGQALGLGDVSNGTDNIIRGGTWSDAAYNQYMQNHPITSQQQQTAADITRLLALQDKYGVR